MVEVSDITLTEREKEMFWSGFQNMGPKKDGYWEPLIEASTDVVIEKYGYATLNLMCEDSLLTQKITNSKQFSQLIGHVIATNDDPNIENEIDYVLIRVPNKVGGIKVLTLRWLKDKARAEIQRQRKDKDAEARSIWPKKTDETDEEWLEDLEVQWHKEAGNLVS